MVFKPSNDVGCFKPFQGFLPVSSSNYNNYLGAGQLVFQTLPGLLTGFFHVTRGADKLAAILFQTLPGLLTGFFY